MTRARLLFVIGTACATLARHVAAQGVPPVDSAPQRKLEFPGFHTRTMQIRGTTFGYQVFVPQLYTPAHHWSVVLFAHGVDERGMDNSKQVTGALGAYVAAHAGSFPAIVVFPQVPVTASNDLAATALGDLIYRTALDQTIAEFSVDTARIYMTGISLGAMYAWNAAYQQPLRFAAVAPIAGTIVGRSLTGDSTVDNAEGAVRAAARLEAVAVRLYCGGKDAVQVRCRATAAAFTGNRLFSYIELPGLDHTASWTATYADPEFWHWLFEWRRCAREAAGTSPTTVCGYVPRPDSLR